MELRILGPLQVVSGGAELAIGGRRQRTVLALLLANVDEVVPLAYLIDAVWDERPPATARRQVQNHVSALRRVLDDGGGQHRIVSVGGSAYRMRPDAAQIDARVFAERVAHAQRLAADDPAGAIDELRAALALWRGPALLGLTGRAVEAAAARLNEQRLAAIESRLDLELLLGRQHHLVGELTELVAAHPLRERPVEQLMLALHRSGRQGDALQVYRGYRTRLADEMGLDPSPRLQELHTRMLGDSTIPAAQARVPAPTARPGPRGPAVMPRQIPAAVRHFAGRTAELAALTGLADEAAESGRTVVVSAIRGTAGIGKTALAVHWAHLAADRFPDGQLYVNLRGFDPGGPPVTPADAVRGFLDALGVPAEQIPVGLDAQAALYRSVLAGRRVLVVLDNAWDYAQVRPLLPGSPGCMVVVTSRNQLTGLVAAEGAQPLTLNLFTAAESRELLARRLGPERLTTEPRAIAEITAACARLPLALSIVAARAVENPRFPLAALAEDLRRARRGLDLLDGGDPGMDVRSVFSWSYRQLDPAAARLFRLLSRQAGPDISVGAAASLAGVPVEEARKLLADLARANLVSEHAPERFTFHDLLRAYATELAQHCDSEADRGDAVRRLLDHYLHSAHGADRLLDPHRQPITLPPPAPGATPESFTSRRQALAWFTAERRVLLAAIGQAHDTGFHTGTWQLAWSLTTFLDRRGHWPDWATGQRRALAAATRLGDRPAQARAHRDLARAYAQMGRYDDAHTHLWRALDLFRDAADPTGQAHTHLGIGWLHERQGSHREALTHAEQALELFRVVGHPSGEANALNNIGAHHARLGNHRLALAACQQALAVHRRIPDLRGQADTWHSLGYAHHHLGHHARAITCYRHALNLFREVADRYNEAAVLTHLGDTRNVAGDPGAARDAWLEALGILEELGHADVDEVRARLRSR